VAAATASNRFPRARGGNRQGGVHTRRVVVRTRHREYHGCCSTPRRSSPPNTKTPRRQHHRGSRARKPPPPPHTHARRRQRRGLAVRPFFTPATDATDQQRRPRRFQRISVGTQIEGGDVYNRL